MAADLHATIVDLVGSKVHLAAVAVSTVVLGVGYVAAVGAIEIKRAASLIQACTNHVAYRSLLTT